MSAPACSIQERAQAIASANAHNEASRHAQALALIDQQLARLPGDAELLCAKGSTLYEWGRTREARDSLLQAAAIGTNDPGLPYKLGWACFVSGHVDEALRWMQIAVAADTTQANRHFGLAIALQASGQANEALRSFEAALARNPSDFDCIVQFGMCRMEQGELAAAEALFHRAIAIRPEDAAGWTNLGVSLSRQRRTAEALGAYEQADRIECASGESVGNFVNLAVELSDDGRLEESLAVYERNLPRLPSALGHLGYAGVLLRAGRMREGWRQYEYRLALEPSLSSRPPYRKPVWNGQDLDRRTILLETEQGFGDTIQFVRYASLLKQLGATVVLRVNRTLAQLATGFPGIDRILVHDDRLPEFDFFVRLMSLPRIFGTDRDTVPADIPYVRADARRRELWVDQLPANEYKVGLVWAGNPSHSQDVYRSIPLAAFAPLGDIDGVQFVSLQKGDPGPWGRQPPPGLRLLDPTPDLRDFADTAALVEALDLVIAVDTAVLHLAGATGKPVWALLPAPPDFRWGDVEDVTPWYPTMRLFRQRRRGDWSDVIGRVVFALNERVAAGHPKGLQHRAGLVGESVQAAPRPPNRGAAFGAKTGLFAIAETRYGLLQYRPEDKSVGKSLDWYGEYLQPEMQLLGTLVGPGATVVEAGAGIGAHSVSLASLIGAGGHLMLYESDPVSRRVLQQNLAVAGATNVTIMRGVVGASGTCQAPVESGKQPGGPGIETLDDLRLARLDLLKVNEGVASAVVLDGAADTLWRLRPIVFITTTDATSVAGLEEFLGTFGYAYREIAMPLFDPHNFNLRDDDIFDRRQVVALLAVPEERTTETV